MQSFRPCVRIVTQRKYRLIECFIESGAIRCDWQSRDEYAPSVVVLSENFRPRWTNESKIGGETVRVDRCVRSLVPGSPKRDALLRRHQARQSGARDQRAGSGSEQCRSCSASIPTMCTQVYTVSGDLCGQCGYGRWRDPTGKRTVNADRRQQPSESTSCRTGRERGRTAIGPTPSVSVRCTARRSPRAPPATPAARTGRRTPRRFPGPCHELGQANR